MANAQLTFYSFVRRGLAAGVTSSGADLQVTVATSGGGPDVPPDKTANVKLGLVGPGDIIAFDPRCILKKRPEAGTLDAEADPYPMVEFDQPDLPWRYTSEATDDGKLKVWIALIVLEEGESTMTAAANGKLATVTVNQQKLPDLSKLPYWSHTQLGGPDALSDDLMAKSPQKLVSRLICARRLDTGRARYR